LQNFEVQYIAAGTGQVAATYQVHVDGVGNVGEIQIHMVLT
jgi:hypothetical protein